LAPGAELSSKYGAVKVLTRPAVDCIEASGGQARSASIHGRNHTRITVDENKKARRDNKNYAIKS
jgi:hypothetical protein